MALCQYDYDHKTAKHGDRYRIIWSVIKGDVMGKAIEQLGRQVCSWGDEASAMRSIRHRLELCVAVLPEHDGQTYGTWSVVDLEEGRLVAADALYLPAMRARL